MQARRCCNDGRRGISSSQLPTASRDCQLCESSGGADVAASRTGTCGRIAIFLLVLNYLLLWWGLRADGEHCAQTEYLWAP